MDYRLERAGGPRRAIASAVAAALAVAALLAAVGVAIAAGSSPDTSATLRSIAPTDGATTPFSEVTTGSGRIDGADGRGSADATGDPAPVVPATTLPPAGADAPTVASPAPDPPASDQYDDLQSGTLPAEVPAATSPDTTAPVDTGPIGWPESTPGGGATLGTISIPRLGLEAPLLEGIELSVLDRGPGHWPGTAMPGERGNAVVAGHRTSHGGPFRYLDQLVEGDTVEFSVDGALTTYVVTGTEIVKPTDTWVLMPTNTPTATLFACHPPGSVSQRIVVSLELAS